ncbi:NAD(P)H-binding protein [Prescottella equi]|nr:NAD(P)H-binding protein [Prescottella equi]UPH36044.1 NAD(P)H-binding protein [Prescottella equi]UPH41512.1 NAD(P)H-binding protein [Prescottella equi]
MAKRDFRYGTPMNVFVIGITGRVGRLLAERLAGRGDTVRGLTRSTRDQEEFAAVNIETVVAELGAMTPHDLTSAVADADVIVFAAGSNGGKRGVTEAVDREGVAKTIEAARLAGVGRVALVSVFPEAWRERSLPANEEYYFSVKKEAEVVLTRSGLDWVILRPSLLTDDAETGLVALGPAELHGRISRGDVAATLAHILHEPRIGRQILELNEGNTRIDAAVSRALVEAGQVEHGTTHP